MRGRRTPRNSSSSPSTVLKTNIVTQRANRPHEPWNIAWPASDDRSSPMLRSIGAGIEMTSSRPRPRTIGTTSHQSLPPTFPVFGLRGERSQRASRTMDQRSVRCSRNTRPTTRANCHTSPTVRQATSGLNSDTAPSPSAMAGATTHDSTPIGMAAAAQIAKICRRLYWVIGRPRAVVLGAASTDGV